MRILLLGAGRQGITILQTLRGFGFDNVTVVETHPENLEKAEELGAKCIPLDVNDEKIGEIFRQHDLIIDALPARHGFRIMSRAVEKGVPIIDIAYAEEDPFLLDEKARERGVFVVPDAGFAPGISNLLVGYGLSLWKNIKRISIKVGGIPLKPRPPLNYNITWSPEDLIAEYTRPVKIKKDNKIIEVEALSGVETEYFEEVGYLESFYTDGLRTLLKTVEDVPELEEKTLRYRGHAEIFKILRELHLLEKEHMGNTLKALMEEFKKSGEEDIAILRVEFHTQEGEKGFEIFHRYNFSEKRTAMSELTSFTPAILAKMHREGRIKKKGVIPLEILGQDKEFAVGFLKELSNLGIKVKEHKKKKDLPRRIEKRILPQYFEKIVSGEKTFEIRLANFDCKPGDILVLKEWDPEKGFTGRKVEKIVSYVLKTKDLNFWREDEIEKWGYMVVGFKVEDLI